ncbi:pheromone A receptor-domain-containing protein [Trametes gibbosa]|nr:pheromone A receptor-domain-containing protein [Trametes gibbosa]
MRAELPAISFLCVAALVLVAPVFVSSRNIPVSSLAAWLICCNVIHGVNTLAWAGNDAIHIPVWCDIVTRVLLAAQFALPGSALALVLKLRRCALGRETIRRVSTLTTDLILCLVLPIVCILLHIIVQPHRFDVATNFGCTASIHTSSLSIIFMWIPPLVLCVATFISAVLAIRARLDSGLFFFSHMQDAPRVSPLAFIRPLAISVFIGLVSFSTTIYSMAAHLVSVGGLQPWAVESWNDVHRQMSRVFTIPASSRLDLNRIEVEWWVIPVCTLILVAMTGLAFFSGIRDEQSTIHGALPSWFRQMVLRKSSNDPFGKMEGLSGQTLYSSLSSPMSLHEMKSGLEDTWRTAAPAKVKLAPLSIPEAASQSTLAVSDQDDPFVRSTLTYIESPTGREALGLPLAPLPVAYQPGQRSGSASPPIAPARTPSPPKEAGHKVAAPRPSSLLSGPWPLPPSTIPASPRTPSPKTPITISPPSPTPDPALAPSATAERPDSVASFATSFASSMISIGSLVYDEAYGAPFQDSATGSVGPGLAVPQHIRKVRSRDVLQLPRSLSVGSRARRNGSDGGLSGGIYMTVVKETD